MSVLYQVENLRFQYELGLQNVKALRGVTFCVESGDFFCLNGPSGSGKSTLLHLLGLIEPIQFGHIFFAGRDFKTLRERDKSWIRQFKLGFVFQNFHLSSVLTVEENVEYFLFRQGLKFRERSHLVRQALSWVGLWEHRKRKSWEMSSGQRQRVVIAQAIAKRPSVILADEPTASLDQNMGFEIMKLFKELNRKSGMTFILGSHDPMVLSLCSKKNYLCGGVLSS